MPEHPNPKLRDATTTGTTVAYSPLAYAELSVTTNFTFLTGASHADELVVQAANLGYRAIGITDTNSVAGIVRMHVAAKEVGLKLIVGCRLVLSNHPAVLVWPTDRAAYGRLCQLLTLGKRRTNKGECDLSLHDLLEHHTGLLAAEPRPWHKMPRERANLTMSSTVKKYASIFSSPISFSSFSMSRLTLSGISCGYRPAAPAQVRSVRCSNCVFPGAVSSCGYS